MKSFVSAAAVVSTVLLASCAPSEDPVATKDKLTLVYQALLTLDFDTGISDPKLTFSSADGYSVLTVGTPKQDQIVVEVKTIRSDKTKCTFQATIYDGRNIGSSTSLLGRYVVDTSNVYLSNPKVTVGSGDWAFGLVTFEPSAIDGSGTTSLTRLGTKLGQVNDASAAAVLWQNRLAALKRYCPGK